MPAGATPAGSALGAGKGPSPDARDEDRREAHAGISKAQSAGQSWQPNAPRVDAPAAGRQAPRAAPPPPLARRTQYCMKDGGYACRGEEIGEGGFRRYMRERVGPRHRDDAGRAAVGQELDDIVSAGFDDGARAGIVSPPRPAEHWRVGESLAECYLEDHEGALFPYPGQRDEKNPSANTAGADLVGYSTDGPVTTFLFGEVKTTGDKSRPPAAARRLGEQLGLMRRQHGTGLVRWLILKVKSGAVPRDEKYLSALKSYAKDRWRIAGVMISDAAPDKRDLGGLFSRLAAGARGGERLDLVALYLPVPVERLGDLAGAQRR